MRPCSHLLITNFEADFASEDFFKPVLFPGRTPDFQFRICARLEQAPHFFIIEFAIHAGNDAGVAAIKAIGDPTHTLPIPVPVGYATSSDVTVQGVQGVALGDNTGAGAAVVWIKGHVFFVGGSLKQSEILTIANQLR